MKALIILVVVLLIAGVVYFALNPDVLDRGGEAGRHATDVKKMTPEEAAWDVLGRLANSPDEDLRAQMLDVLATLEDPRVQKIIDRGLERDAEALVRVRAAGVLGERGRTDLVAFVTGLAASEDDSDVFVEAARAYGRIGTPECVAPLLDILTLANDIDADEDAQAEAARSLARIGARDAIPALRTLLESTEIEVVYAAAGALLALGEADAMTRLDAGLAEEEDEEIAGALLIPGCDAVVPVLARIVGNAEGWDDERGLAAMVLAQVGTTKAKEALVTAWTAAQAASPEERKEMGDLPTYLAGALAWMGDGRGESLLAAAVGNGDEDLALCALAGIARIGKGVPVEKLVELATSREERSPLHRELARAWAARAILARPAD